MNNEELYKKALEAVQELFSDTSVSSSTTRTNLNSLIGEIEALIDNAADTYKPGAFVRGAIVVESPAPAVYVPVDTLVTVGGRPRLFVVSAGVARQREVRTGRQVLRPHLG